MDLFVCGPLCDARLRRAVAGADGSTEPASLSAHAVVMLDDTGMAVAVPDPAAQAHGLIWRGLTADQIERVALFHAAYGAGPVDVTVGLGDAACPARMWSAGVAPAAAAPWLAADWDERFATATLFAVAELFARDPRPASATLAWQYPMMLKRGWNRVCAAGHDRPAHLRHDAAPGDAVMTDSARPLGRFFSLRGFDVTHRRFDGASQGPLPREVFFGIDAVLVLPYDPQRDRVVLVEQVRMGALLRGDPNPWVLEPVAGMIDAFETPQAAALRETKEEAGLDVTLREVVSFYPSPGNATDYFYTYIGLCDLPDLGRYAGGLDAEQEDLRLHVLTLDAALALIDTGEIAAGPAITLLYWLALHRDALRVEFARTAS